MTTKQTGLVLGVTSVIPAFIALLAVASLLLASDGGGPTQAGMVTGANVRSEVTEALAQESEVRVIISLRTDQPPTAVDLPVLKQEVAAKQASVLSALSPSSFTIIHQYDAVPAIAGRINAAALEVLAKHPDVALIEIDGVGHGTLTESVPLINADDVHSDPTPATGDGIVVAVLDTGLDTNHPDLSDDLLSEECFLSGGPPFCPNGLATCSGAGCAEDDHGHGSNVTGIITSMGTNGIAATGVAPDADIRAYKVLDANNTGQFSDWLAALNDIISNQPDVALVNMSLGDSSAYKPGNCDGMSIATAINILRARGTTTVVASGNDGHKNGMNYPACVANAVSVGMTYDQNFAGGYNWPVVGCTDNPANVDMVTCASNSDASLDLLAPGADITSTGCGLCPGDPPNTVLFAGTSQATPHVTGVMALVLELHPAYTPDELEYCLESSALVNPTDAGNGVTTPRVDAYQSVYNCSTSPPDEDQEAIFSVRNPDIVAPPVATPCEAAALLTLPGLGTAACTRAAPTPDLLVSPATLGLDTMGGMTDELDAISLSEPFVGPLAPAFHFSVDVNAVGAPGCTAPDVLSEATVAGEADGDIFTDLAPPASPIVGCNALFQDESTQGLNGGNPAGPPPPPPEDDMDALTEPYTGVSMPCDLDGDGTNDSSCPPFSIDAGSAIIGSNDPNGNTIDAADLLVPPGTPAYTELPAGCAAGGLPCVAITAGNLGLDTFATPDDLDALCWFDNQPDGLPNNPPWIAGTYDSDDYFFSLAPNSPTLAALGAGPGAILAPPPFGSPAGSLPVVIAPAVAIGLAAADNLDALKCINGGGGAQLATLPEEEEPHYKCYHIVSTEPPPSDTVTLETQFGTEQGVSFLAPSSLCAPAIKYYEEPDGVGSLEEPHLKCYDIASTDDPDVFVDLTTQFDVEEAVDVGLAQQLCMPVDKEVTYPEEIPPSGSVPEVPHYKCYQITGDPLSVLVDLETQFGTESGVEVLEPALLCAPAEKTIEPDGEPQGSLDAPHLKCYNILGEPLDPPWEVNLQTQFGFENNVQVTVPEQLCVPVVKEIVEPPPDITIVQDLWDKILTPYEPPYYYCDDGNPPPDEIPVSEQHWVCLDKYLHNTGGSVVVDIEKYVDAPDPGDAEPMAKYPTEVSVHCSYDMDEPADGICDEIIYIADGVRWYEKVDTDDDGICDYKDPETGGTGPAILTDLPVSTCIAADSLADLDNEIMVKIPGVSLPTSVEFYLEENFDVHCEGPSNHTFTFENVIVDAETAEQLAWATSVYSPDCTITGEKEVIDVTADTTAIDVSPDPGTQVYVSQVASPVTVESLDENHGPWTPVDSTVTFMADIPAGCDGRWINTGTDTMSHDGEIDYPNDPLNQWGFTAGDPGLIAGDGQSNTIESRLSFQVDQEIGQAPYTRNFELHCDPAGTYTFTFYNKVEVNDPHVLDDPSDNWRSIDVEIEAIAEADLEKVDLQVKPFYCGDTDGDAYEDVNVASTWVGGYECCNGVDDDGDTYIDGRDGNCGGLTNEDGAPWGQTDDWDDQVDEDPDPYPSGQGCPWNGDDDCDGDIDEDPKNDIDDDGDCPFQGDCFTSTLYGGCMEFCDEDPANGFLGFDNDQDGLVDEDGAGRFDFNGNTFIDPCEDYPGYGPLCEDQGQNVDDDGDTMVDEDPLDSPMAVWAEEEAEPEPVAKWIQGPTMTPEGIDVDATITTLAQDFQCNQSGEITQFDFWGSWLYDEMPGGDPMAVSFDLSIHDNVAGPPSHPGSELWTYSTQCMAFPEGEVFYEGWLDPLAGWYEPIADSMVWRYECPIPEGERFVQEEGNIYWLDVHAYPSVEGYYWGWKTTPEYIIDDSVYYDPAAGWVPLFYPGGHPWEEMSLDLSLQVWTEEEVTGHEVYEPHYIVKEVLLNRGPEAWVTATDTKEIDAPDYRVDALEDGKNTCNDLLDNDGDELVDAQDPDCLEEHLWAESGLHACNDNLDNGAAFAEPDGLVDAEDPDCQSLTEVSVECKNEDDFITVADGVHWYVKPPSDSPWLQDHPQCGQYYTTDPDRYAKCVPCKIEHPELDPVGPVNEYCGELVLNPGYCIAADSTPGVEKELDIHQAVDLGYRTHNMHFIEPGGIDPSWLQNPLGTYWWQLYPENYYPESYYIWQLTSWEDNGDGEISASDQIDMELVEGPEMGWGKAWFHVDDVTETVCLEWDDGMGYAICIEPLTGTISDPIGDWNEKWPYTGETCDIRSVDPTGSIPDQLDPSDWVEISCPTFTDGEYVWLHVMDVGWDLWLSQKVVKEHQFDLSCEGETSLHKFIIQNEIQPVEEPPVVDPNPENNELEMEMLVACMEWEPGDVRNLVAPNPEEDPDWNKWDVDVCTSEIETVTVDVTHGIWDQIDQVLYGAYYPSDFMLELVEHSPGLGVDNLGGDSDGDGWADEVEWPILMSSPATDPENGGEYGTAACTNGDDDDDDGFTDAADAGCQTPENLHASGTCSDGLDNDKNGLIDSLDPKCWDMDGDGYSYVDEDTLFNADDMDASKTPEHMQFPWTCDDGVDNDGDGYWDHSDPPNPTQDEPDDNGDGAPDCSPLQLKKVTPPVACASGWLPQAGDTEHVYLGGDGALWVGLDIPLDNLYTPGVGNPLTVSRDLVFHCFQAANPYPTETVYAQMRPAGVHEVDLNYGNDFWMGQFDGEASCPDGTSDLEVLAWDFTYDLDDWHTGVEKTVSTSKNIHSGNHTGPLAGQPVAVLLEKWLNIPPGCDGSLTVSNDETVVIPEDVWYTEDPDGHEATFPDDWLQGPATLTPGNGNTVYVRGLDDPDSEVEELGANYYLTLEESTSVWEDEVFDIYCREPTEPDEEVVFAFRNFLSHRYFPDECDPDNSNNLATHLIVVEVPMDTDGDTVPDDTDNCMYDDNPFQEDYDQDGAGDACDCDSDNGGTPDNQEILRDGTDPLDETDDLPLDTTDDDNDQGLAWEEYWCGTDPDDECGDDCTDIPPYGTDDAWLYDINIDCWVNSSDIIAFPQNINMPIQQGVINPKPFQCRFDVAPDGWINSSDILRFSQRLTMPTSCTPP